MGTRRIVHGGEGPSVACENLGHLNHFVVTDSEETYFKSFKNLERMGHLFKRKIIIINLCIFIYICYLY